MNLTEQIQDRAARNPRQHTGARTTIRVDQAQSTAYDAITNPKLVEIRISETFKGDLEGKSAVRALQVMRDDRTAIMVSLQRFTGKLGGRPGTFVLQGAETIEAGKIRASWFVVPGSGTGELVGLRGEGGFEGTFDKGSQGTLDYWFE